MVDSDRTFMLQIVRTCLDTSAHDAPGCHRLEPVEHVYGCGMLGSHVVQHHHTFECCLEHKRSTTCQPTVAL